MNIIVKIVKTVIGIFFGMAALGGILSIFTTPDQNYTTSIVMAVICAIVAFLCFKPSKSKNNVRVSGTVQNVANSRNDVNNQKTTNDMKKAQAFVTGTIADGLGLPEGVPASVSFFDDNLEIISGSTHFSLKYSKVVDMQAKTNFEIEKQYVSSAGGAMLFGPLGAIIGGRVKEKKHTTIEYYFIISFMNKNNEIEFISLKLMNMIASNAAKKAINQYRDKFNKTTIEL